MNHLQWIFYSWGAIDKLPNCTPLWFLPCIFICCIFFYFLNKINNTAVQTVICILSVTLDYILYLFINIQLPWHINVALIGMAFMFIGLKIKESNLLKNITHCISFIFYIMILAWILGLNLWFDVVFR